MQQALITSDLHTDHYLTHKKRFDADYRTLYQPILDLRPDHLLIAGDISNNAAMTVDVLNWFGHNVNKVYFVWGNHDRVMDRSSDYCRHRYYAGQVSHIHEYYEAMLRKLSANVICLDGNIVEMTEKTTIGGCMGMYDFSYCYKRLGLNRNKMLEKWCNWYDSYWGISTSELLRLIESETEKTKKLVEGKPTIMMTHMVPTNDCVAEQFKTSYCTGFFTFDGDKLMTKLGKNGGKWWIAGHTHDRFMKQMHGITLAVNAYGYPDEMERFRNLEHFLIEIE